MPPKESTFKNMVMTLFLVTLFSSSSVGMVYEMTYKRIVEVKLAKKINAMKSVLPHFNNNPLEEEYAVDGPAGTLNFYPAKENGQWVGTAVETFTEKGFNGTIRLMVGFLPNGTINNIAIIEQKETPGLGDKIEPKKSDFMKQFFSKKPTDFKISVKKDGGDIDGVTAATISSRAFCDAVQTASDYFTKDHRKS